MHDSDRRARAWALFDRVAELPRDERAATLARETDDPALRTEVEALLLDYDRTEANAGGTEQAGPQLATGTDVGRWRVERLIGCGGMGEVYLAHRIGSDYEQRAAL